jgi:4'-phosphopantetheinyl transferase
MTVADGECHVWIASLDDLAPHTPALDRLLTAAERAQVERFRQERDRARARLSRAVLRLLLGRYLQRPPAAIDVGRDCPRCGQPHGKPRLLDDGGPQFSVSHSGDLVLFAVTAATPVGVDVESLVGRTGTLDASLVSTVLSPGEQVRLWEAAAADRWAVFLRYWTAKEAVVKQFGAGLAIPLDSVVVDQPAGARMVSVDTGGGARAQLRVVDLQLDNAHIGAVATDPSVTQIRSRTVPTTVIQGMSS